MGFNIWLLLWLCARDSLGFLLTFASGVFSSRSNCFVCARCWMPQRKCYILAALLSIFKGLDPKGTFHCNCACTTRVGTTSGSICAATGPHWPPIVAFLHFHPEHPSGAVDIFPVAEGTYFLELPTLSLVLRLR
jgi:hypothetical protein